MNKQAEMFDAVTTAYSYRLAFKCIVIIIFGAVLTAFFLYAFLQKEIGSSYAESYNAIARLREELLYKSAIIYLTTALVQIAGIIIISLLYSHRVAGPLYKFGIFARKIASGDLSGAVRLRRHDAVHPMADDLNGITARYKEILGRLEAKTREMRDAVSAAHASSQANAQNTLKNVSEKADEIQKILYSIKL
ncbi:MAG: methyl-accepting chemotaxis protein [Nitrospirae bacterium]|nr:methyl-accepting chemotaxis protein [Nitrospirota bacterium]